MKIIKKIIKALLVVIAVLITGFAGLIAFAFFSEYKPDAKEIISVSGTPSALKDSSTLTLLTWNIGYAGLDRDMDFFYDGGTKVKTPFDKFRSNLDGIEEFLEKNDSVDFIILQEVDRKSKRSYRTDEYEEIARKLPGFKHFFAKNYNVFFVPSPLNDPMGKVVSGIATFSRPVPESVARYSLPGNFGFPTQLFYLSRCFLACRYPLAGGKELVFINTHNEAFDEGDIRKSQLEELKKFILNEYSAGNYVILGGDWNECPPDFKPVFSANKADTSQMKIESGFFPDNWKWAFDPGVPSNRSVKKPYNQETTPTTVIDFFLLSPNIELVSVKCQDLGFSNSDHNPVIARVRLK